MNEMKERVARAILKRVPLGYGMTTPEAEEYASAAIAAMREVLGEYFVEDWAEVLNAALKEPKDETS